MRRFAAQTSLAEKFIISLYWLVSGYALRAWRAVVALLVVVVLAAIVFSAWGFEQPTKPSFIETFPDALAYSLESATALLRGVDQPLTPIGRWCQTALRLVGPILFGLALLSLRGRTKR